jgi:hypothetical protein
LVKCGIVEKLVEKLLKPMMFSKIMDIQDIVERKRRV